MKEKDQKNEVTQLKLPFTKTSCWQFRKGDLVARVTQEGPTAPIYITGPYGTTRGGWKSVEEAMQYCCKLGYVYDDFMTI